MGLLLLLYKPTTALLVLFILLLLLPCSNADDGSIGDIATTASVFPPPPPVETPLPPSKSNNAFKPSIAIIVGVLTTLFTVTFLLLLYTKHCKRGGSHGGNSGGPPRTERKNSGIDRAVIESLPVFRFQSLRGPKDGLECTVCISRFEPTEVLRLLPKCKHAFHVECVDTWLDAHSTCPLCRYRVDPEDVLLIEEARLFMHQPQQPHHHQNDAVVINIENDNNSRVSGRHSSALEHRPGSGSHDVHAPSSFRRSLDSWTWFRKKTDPATASNANTTTAAAAGCSSAERSRKDGLLLLQKDRSTRLEHRIIVSSPNSAGPHQRWSDVHPSELLFLQSEMIMKNTRQQRSGNNDDNINNDNVQLRQQVPLRCPNNNNSHQKQKEKEKEEGAKPAHGDVVVVNVGNGGSSVINDERSMSETTGLSRFSNRGGGGMISRSNEGSSNNNRHQNRNEQRQRQRQLKLVSRWLTWISSHHHHHHHHQSRQPALRPEQSNTCTGSTSSPTSPATPTPLSPPPPALPTSVATA